MAGNVEMSQQLLRELAQTLVDSVVFEAKKDLAKQGRKGTPQGQPEGLPVKGNFLDSFDYRISGKSTIEITSDWPWVQQLIEGRKPFKMWWLTHGQRRGHAVPLVQPDGTVLFRMAPLSLSDAWIHPGFARHTFVQRGVKKGRVKMAEMIAAEVFQQLSQGDPFA
jgi:hypothetical protein